jgi:hypothetical protein
MKLPTLISPRPQRLPENRHQESILAGLFGYPPKLLPSLFCCGCGMVIIVILGGITYHGSLRGASCTIAETKMNKHLNTTNRRSIYPLTTIITRKKFPRRPAIHTIPHHPLAFKFIAIQESNTAVNTTKKFPSPGPRWRTLGTNPPEPLLPTLTTDSSIQFTSASWVVIWLRDFTRSNLQPRCQYGSSFYFRSRYEYPVPSIKRAMIVHEFAPLFGTKGLVSWISPK